MKSETANDRDEKEENETGTKQQRRLDVGQEKQRITEKRRKEGKKRRDKMR